MYHNLVNPNVLEHAQGNINAGFAEGPDLSIKVGQPRHRYFFEPASNPFRRQTSNAVDSASKIRHFFFSADKAKMVNCV